MKWTPRGVTLLPSHNEANGLTRDPQGRLIACEHAASADAPGTRGPGHRRGGSLPGQSGSIAPMTSWSSPMVILYFTDSPSAHVPQPRLGFCRRVLRLP